MGQLKQVPKGSANFDNLYQIHGAFKKKMEELACRQGLDYADWQGFLEAYLKAEHESDDFC